MQTLPGHEVTYDPDWFTEETLLKALALDLPDVSTEPPLLESAPPSSVSADPRAIHQDAWSRMMRHSELKDAIQANGKTAEAAYQEFQSKMTGSSALEPTLFPAYTLTKRPDGGFVHQVGGKDIVAHGPSPDAEQHATKLQVIVSIARVIGDGILLVLAGLGVKLVLSPARVTQEVVQEISVELQDLAAGGSQTPRFQSIVIIGQIAQASTAAQKVEKLAKLLTALPNAELLMTNLLDDMTPLQKALTLLSLLAGIALLFATAGAKLAAAIIALAIAFGKLIADISACKAAYDSYTAGPSAAHAST